MADGLADQGVRHNASPGQLIGPCWGCRDAEADLIPLCHPLAITRVAVDFELDRERAEVRCTAQVETLGRTGVEMEALTAVQVGLLTIYDMCKAADRGMVITDVRVIEKMGGKSGHWVPPIGVDGSG